MNTEETFTLTVTGIDRVCEAGEQYGRRCMQEGKIPVFSCEGGCIKGEIARQTANLIAREEGFARACHGELFAVPHADLAKWIREADRVVVIDGCSMFCHGRIAENIIDRDRLININILSVHKKYADLMNVDDVGEEERKQTARETAARVLASLHEGIPCCPDPQLSCGCDCAPQPGNSCCG